MLAKLAQLTQNQDKRQEAIEKHVSDALGQARLAQERVLQNAVAQQKPTS